MAVQKNSDPLKNLTHFLEDIKKHSSIYQLINILLSQSTPLPVIQSAINYNNAAGEKIGIKEETVIASIADILLCFDEKTQLQLSRDNFFDLYNPVSETIDLDKPFRLGRYELLSEVLTYFTKPLLSKTDSNNLFEKYDYDSDWDSAPHVYYQERLLGMFDSMLFHIKYLDEKITPESLKSFEDFLEVFSNKIEELNRSKYYQSLLEKDKHKSKSYEEVQKYKEASNNLEALTPSASPVEQSNISSEFDSTTPGFHLFLTPSRQQQQVQSEDYYWVLELFSLKILTQLWSRRQELASTPAFQATTQPLCDKLLAQIAPQLQKFELSNNYQEAVNEALNEKIMEFGDGADLMRLLMDGMRHNISGIKTNYSLQSVIYYNTHKTDLAKVSETHPDLFKNLDNPAVAKLVCPIEHIPSLKQLPSASDIDFILTVMPHLDKAKLSECVVKNALEYLTHKDSYAVETYKLDCHNIIYQDAYMKKIIDLVNNIDQKVLSFTFNTKSKSHAAFDNDDTLVFLNLSELKLVALSSFGYGAIEPDKLKQFFQPHAQEFLFSFDKADIDLAKITPILEKTYFTNYLSIEKAKNTGSKNHLSSFYPLLAEITPEINSVRQLTPEFFEKYLLSIEISHNKNTALIRPKFKV